MTFALMQPYFFPYIGYFSLIENVDHFMIFDDTQYVKKSWMSRNRLLNTSNGCPFYVHAEIQKPVYKARLNEVLLAGGDQWKLKILEQLKNYKRIAPFYDEVKEMITDLLLSNQSKGLSEFCISSIRYLVSYLSIETEITIYSEENPQLENEPEASTWGLETAKAMKASKYVNSPGGVEFILPEPFSEAGIKLGFIEPKLEAYKQGGGGFIPYLSILDVLLFNGPERTLDMIKKDVINWKN